MIALVLFVAVLLSVCDCFSYKKYEREVHYFDEGLNEVVYISQKMYEMSELAEISSCILNEFAATEINYYRYASGFKKCDRRRTDFNRCLSKAIYGAVTSLDKPLKSHGLPNLYDLEYPPDVKAEFGNSTYGLKQKFSKLRFIGLSEPQEIAARMDFGPLSTILTIEAI
ncbi:hypothetical protein Zmor_018826 [Zophobas morio]|uniref:Uncharacterized protein n=1 Tax=Zophobas morio TaxID=2755281 RepID=A0AA38ME07_9CUCU|nr:hypothetical protein Zmor_018826 [Zophobas morio]